MRSIEIEWQPLGITVVAELSSQINRNLANALWEFLPYNALQNHALVSGEHLYHLVPLMDLVWMQAEYKEDRTKSADGTLFLSQLQHLAIKCGPLSEYIPAAPIGRVIAEHLPRLQEVGRACWDACFRTKKVIEVRVRRQGDPAPVYELPRANCELPPKAQALLQQIQAEIEKIWIHPPQEILRMHRGEIASGAGSYNQYFSTLVFLNGETRPLGYGALNGLLRLSQNQNFSLDVLREMTPTFIRTTAEFLGYCGLDTLWGFTQEMLRVLSQLQNKQQYSTLIGALALYVNVLNTWNLQFFPWHHGADYPALRPAQAGAET